MDICWNIDLLGGLRLRKGDQLITHFRTKKTAVLLAYLAYYPEKAHSREVLVDMLWPESGPDAGRHSLSLALSALRRQLEPISGGNVILADRFSVQLNPQRITTDVAQFAEALESAAAAACRAQSLPERERFLTQALDLYQGPLLPGFFENWFLPEQQRLARRFWEATSALLSLLQERGEIGRALDYARRAVNLHPLLENAHQELIRLLAASGDASAALRQYGLLERTLQGHLGCCPSVSTRALAEAIQTDSAMFVEASSVMVGASTKKSSPSTAIVPPPPNEALPTGTVTFLWVRMESKASLLPPLDESVDTSEGSADTSGARAALSQQRSVLLREIRRWNSYLVHHSATSLLIAFQAASKALDCAVASQRAVAAAADTSRAAAASAAAAMALHSADVDLVTDGYQGEALLIGEGLVGASSAGQILCCEATFALLQRQLKREIGLTDLGTYRLRNIDILERLFQVDYPGMRQRAFPPPNADPACDTT